MRDVKIKNYSGELQTDTISDDTYVFSDGFGVFSDNFNVFSDDSGVYSDDFDVFSQLSFFINVIFKYFLII